MAISNTYFQFKQFTIHQDRCAMKVSTDACIQGAWTPIGDSVQRVLDIGAGTGLLSLMLAQRKPDMCIDAIELDEAAAQQAKENILCSPWNDKITVLQGDATQYAFTHTYDMVICNPPFFNNSLLGDDAKRNSVRHTLALTYPALLGIIDKVLAPQGYASILLPKAEHEVWKQLLAKNGYYIHHELKVYPRAGGDYNRVVSLCCRIHKPTQEETLVIYNDDKSYTFDFIALLQPYYLNL